jgi:response regulator RpfG family c-di-GMP phosphodiesterase
MSTEESTEERASILLVDDMEDNLVALEAVLGSLNEPLVRARSGEEAMKALLRQRFAVVLLDIRMPGMDGFETAANIKRLDQTKDVPIIFLTGTDSDAGYAFRGYATGAADYLTKPFDPWVLRAKVTVFLDLHRKNQQLERMLAQQQGLGAQVNARLDALENQLTEASPDLVKLRTQVRDLRALVAGNGAPRGRGELRDQPRTTRSQTDSPQFPGSPSGAPTPRATPGTSPRSGA